MTRLVRKTEFSLYHVYFCDSIVEERESKKLGHNSWEGAVQKYFISLVYNGYKLTVGNPLFIRLKTKPAIKSDNRLNRLLMRAHLGENDSMIIKNYCTDFHTHFICKSYLTCRASMKALVPDLAIVPRLFTRSALVMPTPES